MYTTKKNAATPSGAASPLPRLTPPSVPIGCDAMRKRTTHVVDTFTWSTIWISGKPATVEYANATAKCSADSDAISATLVSKPPR